MLGVAPPTYWKGRAPTLPRRAPKLWMLRTVVRTRAPGPLRTHDGRHVPGTAPTLGATRMSGDDVVTVGKHMPPTLPLPLLKVSALSTLLRTGHGACGGTARTAEASFDRDSDTASLKR